MGLTLDRSAWTQASRALDDIDIKNEEAESKYWSAREGRWITTNVRNQKIHTDMLAKIYNQSNSDAAPFIGQDLQNSVWAEIIGSGNDWLRKNKLMGEAFTSFMNVKPSDEYKPLIIELSKLKIKIDNTKDVNQKNKLQKEYNDKIYKYGRNYLNWKNFNFEKKI